MTFGSNMMMDSGGGVNLPIAALTSTLSNNGGLTTYTFNSVNIGSASADRIIVIGCSGFRISVSTVSSATIGGISATIHLNNHTTFSNLTMMSAVVPTGTTTTISITYTTGQAGFAMSVYSVQNTLSNIPVISVVDITAPLNQTISPAAGTAIIANMVNYTGANHSLIWSGTANLIKQDNTFFGGGPTHSSALKIFDIEELNKTVIGTPNNTGPKMNIIGFK